MWGALNDAWKHYYLDALTPYFELIWLDARVLADIDPTITDQEGLHQAFTAGGIEQAVEKLIEARYATTHLLAFSVGGVIAWRYALRIQGVQSLTAVSATRLRKEFEVPECDIKLYFGAEDQFRPDQAWAESKPIECVVVPKKKHPCYRETEVAQLW